MELQNLRYFKKIAELEHMTRASEVLNIAQPALSKVVSNIEKDLQVKLFDRIGKRISINDNGRILLKYTNLALNALDDARIEIAEKDKKHDNTVVLAMNVASKLLPDIISEFYAAHPKIKIAIVQHEELNWERMNCDLVVDSSQETILSDSSIQLLEERILLAVPASHQLAANDQILLEAAADEAFISLQKGKGLSNLTTAYCLAAGFEPKIIFESDDPATIRGLIGLGLGIAFIPEITWKGVVDSRMKLLSVSNIDCKRYINVSWEEGRYFSQPARLLRDFLVDYFKRL